LILTLQTNSFGFHGGIPTYNRILCRALDGLHQPGTVLVAMDDPTVTMQHAAELPNLKLSAFGGNRWAFAGAVLRTVMREPITTIIAGHVNYGPLCLLLKLLRPQIKFGIIIYGCEVWERVSFLRRHALKSADFIISISEYTGKRAIEINALDPERVSVLPNALEWPEDAGPAAAPSKDSNELELLSVGRLDASERQKGFDDVIRALPLVALKIPNVRYKIVGTGTDLERHKQVAVAAGVSDRVDFLGALSTQGLHERYQACDVFVMPSAQEGFGFVYLEAMQYCKPVVAARSGGAPEVVEDGISGLLVDYGDTKQLAQTLTDLCWDPVLRVGLGRAGHQILQEKFTFLQFQETFREILEHRGVMNEKPSQTDSTL
jgi:phosphatidylinositol alpha-1,6-mannosyltransferase